MTGDKIITYLFGINALINVILIALSERRYKSDSVNVAYGRNFWQAYLYFVPFFVTNSIIKEIENKRKKQKSRMDLIAKNYERFIDSWKVAANDLNIKIHTQFVIKLSGTQEFKCPVFIEHFGSKLGTVIFSINDRFDFKTLKESEYYYSALNPSSYSTYNRELFIDTLNDWGFFGDQSDKPEWYTGEPWSE
jgi:hypothetical protein